MLHRVRILYADANATDRIEVCARLRDCPDACEVTEVSSLGELQAELLGGYDVLLCDVNIDGLKWTQLVATVRSVCGEIPIVVVTALGSERIANELVRQGISHFVMKSADGYERLVAVVRGAVRASRDNAPETVFGGGQQPSERFLRATLDGLLTHIAIVDQQGQIIAVNSPWREFARANGADPDRLSEGSDYLRVCDEAVGKDAESAHWFAEELRALLRGTRERVVHEYPCHSADEQRWFIARATRIPVAGPPRVGIAHEDITQRRLAEEELQRQAQFLQTLIDSMPSPVFYKGRDGRYLGCNRAFSQWTGVPERQVLGKTDCELFADRSSDLFRDSNDDLYRSGAPQTTETTIRLADGAEYEVVLHKAIFPGPDGGVGGVIGIVDDVTEQRKAQRISRQRDIELAHMNRLQTVGEMAATLAHELNQPLYAINNYVRGACRRLARLGRSVDVAEITDAMDRVSVEVNRASAIVTHLREFVRGRGPRRELTDIGQVLRQAYDLLQPLARDHCVQLTFNVGEDLPLIRMDSIQIEQVVVNLVANAMDAVAMRPEKQRKVIVAAMMRGEKSVEVEVRDWGCGVAGHARERLFEAFNSTKRQGLGMGLAISRRVVESHGGKIWLGDDQTCGADFHFTLPVHQGREESGCGS